MGKRKEYSGEVISDKMQKTRVIRAVRLTTHPKYHKVMKRYSTFTAHDERNETKIGDLVRIAETRPLSKSKRYRIIGVLKKATLIQSGESDEVTIA